MPILKTSPDLGTTVLIRAGGSTFGKEVVQTEEPVKTLNKGKAVELEKFEAFQSHNFMS